MSSPSLKLLELKNLKVHFPITRGVFKKVIGQVKAVDDISFSAFEGETLALVGESGCGKSTTARSIVQLPTPTSGSVVVTSEGDSIELTGLKGDALRKVRPKLQMIFQKSSI